MIKEFERVFVSIDGVDYFDYKGVYDDGDCSWYSRHLNISVPLVSRNVFERFGENNIDKYLDDSFVLNDNDPIHVVPDCKYSVRDIRNNYQIKRQFDDGVCNVYSPISYSGGYSSYVSHTVVVKPKNTIIFLQKCKNTNDAITYAREYFSEHFSLGDLVVSTSLSHVTSSSKINNYLPLLLHTAKKPCISYKKIQFNTNELTPDVLTIMRAAGIRRYDDADAEKNFLIQLAVLNQHNWRDYPLSVRAAFNTMRQRLSIMTEVFSHTSRYPKYIKEMYDMCHKKTVDTINPKDVDMVREYYAGLLGLKNETMFVNEITLHEKLEEANVNIYDFNKVFNLTTRITPKKYDA